MDISYWILLTAVAPVFLIILGGFVLRRVHWLTMEADQSLLRICINVLMPCLILDSVLGNPALEKFENISVPPLVGFATFCLGYLVALPIGRLLRLSENKARTF